MNIYLIHPIVQLTGAAVALAAAYHGFQRARSRHFGAQAAFKRNLHAGLGGTALVILMGGMAGGVIIISRFLGRQPLQSLHGTGALILLPLMLIGISTGFYLYFYPTKNKILPAVHGINNLLILFMLVFQAYSGLQLYAGITAG